jgi:endonuclease/exonuclease/phosphatase family metal-dependent hydrolase
MAKDERNLAEGVAFLLPPDSAARKVPGALATGAEELAGSGVAARDPRRFGLAVRAATQKALVPPGSKSRARSARRSAPSARAAAPPLRRPPDDPPAAPGWTRASAPVPRPATIGKGDGARTIEVAPQLEIQIGRSNFLPFWFLELGALRGQAVCKVKASGVNYRGEPGSWSGSGFLVAPSLLLTNHHVLNSVNVAAQATCVFAYEETRDGELRPTRGFRLRPDVLFVTSPVGAEGLDYTFVWVEGEPGREFGFVPLDRSAFQVVDEEHVNIIQHPRGNPKVVSLQENEVKWQGPAVIHYETDTEPGSSGSCVFSNDWRAVALHHASMPSPGGGALNEGIKLSAIAAHLETLKRDEAQREAAEEVLRQFRGSDEILGFFGSLGRKESAATGVETVVDLYRGEAGDVDVAFWNVEWFTNRFEEKLEAVGEVVARMNLDVWALEETSPEATKALVVHLKERYDLDFDWAASEPEAPNGKQSTAVLWNTATVRGERQEWPEEIDAWFKVHSTDFDSLGLEAVEGKVFDRYPGLFHFEAKNRAECQDPFDFYVVPLHLKAMDEGSKRRRMASKILLAAVNRMITRHGKDADWILGGDFNAELASDDFDALTDAGLVPLSAEDEGEGAMSYIKRPKSLIDHIFLSQNLSRTYGARDYFIVAADRTFPSYVTKVSDHRPVLVRLSLRPTVEEAASQVPASLAEEMSRLFSEPARAARSDRAA